MEEREDQEECASESCWIERRIACKESWTAHRGVDEGGAPVRLLLPVAADGLAWTDCCEAIARLMQRDLRTPDYDKDELIDHRQDERRKIEGMKRRIDCCYNHRVGDHAAAAETFW